ncbi:MAG: hypothetical protein AB7U73_10170 [Pirellulales bacterium]
MSEPSVFVGFEGNQRQYRPGDILSGHYRVAGVEPDQLEALELSVLWHTEGKGDQDLAVHLFQRFLADDDGRLDGRQAGWFSTELPVSPLSYEGRIVKIRWCVRVRLFARGGREIVREEPFQLGHVRAAPPPAPTTPASEVAATGEPSTNSQRVRTPAAAGSDGTTKAAASAEAIDDSREADFTTTHSVEPPAEES